MRSAIALNDGSVITGATSHCARNSVTTTTRTTFSRRALRIRSAITIASNTLFWALSADGTVTEYHRVGIPPEGMSPRRSLAFCVRSAIKSASSKVRAAPPSRWRGALKILLVTALLLVLGGVAARAALPSYLRSYVNHTLDQSPDFDGQIGEIEVHLWRGAYTIFDLKIVKTQHAVPSPFFESPRVDFSLDWRALLKGAARGKMVLDRPRLNFVHGPTEEQTQTGAHQPWIKIIDDLYPFRIDRAEVIDGEIHFQAFHTQAPVDVFLSNVRGSITNLTNIEDKLDPLVAEVKAKGTAMGSGDFDFEMSFDPQSHRPNFTLAARVLRLDVTQLNSLTRGYGDFDFERGRFDLAIELNTKDGMVTGYAKPLFRDLKVLSLQRDSEDPLQLFWEALVGLVSEIFKNWDRDQFGTRFAIAGYVDNPRTNILEVVGNVLRNAFIRAYLPRLEQRESYDFDFTIQEE